MNRQEKTILAVFALALVLSLLALLLWQETGADEPEILHMSVLLDGSAEAGWRNFRRGADAAAVEYNVDLRYVYRYEHPGQAGQLQAMEAELDSGAEVVAVAPLDAAALTEYLQNHSVLQPVMVVGPEVHAEAVAGCVAVDSQAQASLLAGAIVDSGARRCRIYLRTDCGELDLQRMEGLTESLEKAGVETDTMTLEPGSVDWEPGMTAVALDAGTLADLAEELPEEVPVYGMGVSGPVLELLEAGRIRALAAVSEYDLGYLTLSAAAGLLSGHYQSPELLTPFLVTGEEMFDPPYAGKLVPIG